MALFEPLPRAQASSRRRGALVDGFSLHANTSVDAADRAALERLCRYILRPISADRLTCALTVASSTGSVVPIRPAERPA